MDKSIKNLSYILILMGIISLVSGYIFPEEKRFFLWLSFVGLIPGIIVLILTIKDEKL
jgi:hypothetical protein